MKKMNASQIFIFYFLIFLGFSGCLEKTEPLKEWSDTITIEQQDLEYCVGRRLTNSPYANSGEVEGITPSTSFTICTEEQFLEIGNRSQDWNNHFLLKADLDFVHYDLKANHTFKPIGVYRTTLSSGDPDVDYDIGFEGTDNKVELDYVEDDHPFTGVFDGNNHTIYRFRATFLNDINHQYKSIGMFPFLSVPGVIKNLKLVKHRVMKSEDDEVEYGMGMLVGYNDGGEIDNVKIESGSMYAGDDRVGGLVGWQAGGKIINCSVEFEDTIRGDDNVGGLVGEFGNGLILQSNVLMKEIFGKNNIGGLVGKVDRGVIRDSKVDISANIHGSENNIGGFIGSNSYGSVIYSSAEFNGIYGFENVGGMIGKNSEGEIHYSNVLAYQNIEGADNRVGGFVGLNENSPISNSKTVMKNITGKQFVGGFIGESIESSIKNNSVEIDNLLLVSHHGGGLIGQNTGGEVSGANVQVLYIDATNTTCPHFGTTGGLIGEARDGEKSEGRILHSQANITSTLSGFGIMGGLVGKNNAEINFSHAITNQIRGVKTTDEVGGDSIGGLVGYNYSDGHYQSGRIEYSYAINTNEIYGEGNVGGLVGKNGHYRDLEVEESGENPICGDGSEDVNAYRRIGGEIEFSYVDGEKILSGEEGHNVGGFIGKGWETRVQASYADIHQSVSGEGYSGTDGADYPVENIGGFIGHAKDSSIRSSYALVTNVNGSYRNVGGFVGESVTSTFMYNFVVGNTQGFSPEGWCHSSLTTFDPKSDPVTETISNLTKQHPTQAQCEAVGVCDDDSSITDSATCLSAGYCYDPKTVDPVPKEELEEFESPQKCIHAGACYAFSTSYTDALSGDAEPIYDFNMPNTGTEIVDEREMCLASFSCIDANGEKTEATTYEECVQGGICLTTFENNALDYEGEGNLPQRYDDGNDGSGDEVTLADGTLSTNYLRNSGDDTLIRDRQECCGYGGLEEDGLNQIRWVANKWVKNYWVSSGYNWSYARKSGDESGESCIDWTNSNSWKSTRSTEKGSHSIPDVGRFAGKFDYNWSVENKRYYHESLWIQNFTTNHTTNTCNNESGKLYENNTIADATGEEAPIVDAYDCGVDGDDSDPYIDGRNDGNAATLSDNKMDQVSCHDFSNHVNCVVDVSFVDTNRNCDCGHSAESSDSQYKLLEYRPKEFIFEAKDVVSCDNVFDPLEAGVETETSGDEVVDHDQDQTTVDIGEPEKCNDSMVLQFGLQDQLRVSYWVDNSEKASAACSGGSDDQAYGDYGDDSYGVDDGFGADDISDDFSEDEFSDDYSEDEFGDEFWLEAEEGQSIKTTNDCYQERFLFKKENPPLKYWDFNYFWNSYLDKYPTIQKVDK